MLCYPFDESRLEKWGFPVVVQPKLDGERCRAFMNADKPVMLSSQEHEFNQVPHLTEQLRAVFAAHPGIHLDGELYIHGIPFEIIHSIASRRVNQHPLCDRLEYHIFDVIDEEWDQLRRLDFLRSEIGRVVGDATHLRIVETRLASSIDSVFEHCDRFIEDGYEGIIIRHLCGKYVPRRSTSMMKWKPSRTGTFYAVDCQEEVDKNGRPKGLLGSITCRDTNGRTFRASCSKIPHYIRSKLWALRQVIPQTLVDVEYQNLTSRGVPRFGRVKALELQIWRSS